MVKVIGVRFKKAGKIYYFDPDGIDIEKGQNVIVETSRGIEFGEVVVGPKDVDEESIVSPLKKVLRIATLEDKIKAKENKEKEKEAFDICLKKIEEHGLEMKLIDVEYTFDNNKVIFYFTADGRIDFRELVKDLAAIFRTRIELRQIGVRDETKMLGGIGPCGRTLCCCTWLGEFEPVSIKMAKDQNLSLNPSKISGICGRLLCCLRYEQDSYKQLKKGLPNAGEKVNTPDGKGIVIENNVLRESVKVRLINNENEETGELDLSDDIYIYHKGEIERIEANEELGLDNEEDNESEADEEILLDENLLDDEVTTE
ncbi:Cell fate regulator YaaT, PSP1 superfamily (controls sporulation, competence, biofilm development) [Caminicella sporogenes DSM 14501]|uniref:Cell fate regulator YaaT, PSP1 superfamily (Controls sporulation, competence, biofilm development) n=1 Tax=Caminicella sporogenes DSM 14501 TaxID=1121266 RepID=A0A1M6SDN1_9FIRM|nr:stage 0 sporulation family protein [Caminicella sporogenes]RKD26627.1 stage 0 sporulation protein [Caminicella sporogenes]SHK42884.1 Cell fate regulator YaaT, PSP1 superfamily (controls sporulation, competence, biofilm development) [Caminicella sporogenes DSM 14501]